MTHWVKSVDYDRAMALLANGRGKLFPVWGTFVWRYWHALEWDQRPTSELNTQPKEVQAFAVTHNDLRSLGIRPAGPAIHLLFVSRDLHWAAVVSPTSLYEEDDA